MEVRDKVEVERVEDIESETQLEEAHHKEDDVEDSESENVDIVNCDSPESLRTWKISELSSLLPISRKITVRYEPCLGTTEQEKRRSTKGGDARRQKGNVCQAKPGGLRMNPKTY